MKKLIMILFIISITTYGEKDHSISYHLNGEDQLIVFVNAWDQKEARKIGRKMMGSLCQNNGLLSEDGWKENISPKIVEESIYSVIYKNHQLYKYRLIVDLEKQETNKNYTFWYCLATLLFSGVFQLAIS